MKPARGGFAVGLLVGLLLGLVLALGVALYVSKVPVPFVNKVPQRTADQDAAEAERNKGWDPNAGLLGSKAAGGPRPAASAAGAASAPPAAPRTAAAASVPSAGGAGETLSYFVQVGAYTRGDEAEAQRAKLALQGFDTRITEREQSGRTVYRVRGGPYDSRGDAEAAIEKLQAAGFEAALVRVQKQ